MRVGRALATAVSLATLLTVAACASGPPPPANTLSTPRPGATPSATSSTGFEREAVSPDPNFDTGYTILITPAGFHPATLVSPCCEAVTWKNTTNAPETVVFDNEVGGSGQPVPPGGIYVFAPQSVESILYHSRETPTMTGRLQMNQLPA